MKRYITKIAFVAALSLAVTSCKNKASQKEKAPTNEFTISGHIDGLGNNDLRLVYLGKLYDTRGFDTIKVQNGNFTFSDTIADMNLVRIVPMNWKSVPDSNYIKKAKGGGFYPSKSGRLMAFAFPGATIKIAGKITDFMDAYPSGDEANNSLGTINKMAYPYYNKAVNLMVKSSYAATPKEQKALQEEAGKIDETVTTKKLAYVKSHLNTVGAIWYLKDMIMRRQINDSTAIALYRKIPESAQNNPYYKDIKSRVNGIIATRPGSPVPEIKTNTTLDGKPFDIKNLRGKYVLIDFWGTWCGPCVGEMPKIKQFIKDHKDQFYMVGITSGNTKEQVAKFVKQHEYGWQQIIGQKGNTPDNYVSKFNVQAFPTKFIIDPEGKIVKRFVGASEAPFKLLEKLLAAQKS